MNVYDVRVNNIRIFADGSTLVKFYSTVKIGFGQSLFFTPLGQATEEGKER